VDHPQLLQRVQQALAKGQPVFVDYTAAWCVTCQFNKQTVLGKAEFAALMQSNPAIAASLRSLGRAAVPVYALYLPSAPDKPHILSEILSLQAIRQILQPQ
jgi:thiol:disulfide interchange protein DsbD